MKILIIDDEITALSKMKALLSTYGDCTMTTSADQALRLFDAAIKNKKPFDLVCIDIQLSNASGFDILDSLSQMEEQSFSIRSVKLMVTASGTKANLLKAYSKGCDGFLVKPVKRDVLTEKLQAFGITDKQEAFTQESSNQEPTDTQEGKNLEISTQDVPEKEATPSEKGDDQ